MSYSKNPLLLAIVLPVLFLLSSKANASLMFTFQRISDTEAIMTATGSAGLGLPTGPNDGTYSHLELRDVFERKVLFAGPANGFLEQTAGGFFFGHAITDWGILEGDMLANGLFGDDTSPTGTSTLKVGPPDSNAIWGPVGTGTGVWATYESNTGHKQVVQVGAWEIVAPTTSVPEPGSLALVALGLFGLIPALRRR